MDYLPGYALISLFAVVAGARVYSLKGLSGQQRRWAISIVAVFCIGAAIASQADPDLSWLRSYPVLISLSLAGWFAMSLFRPEPATATLARLAGMDVPLERLGYLRKLTAIWVAFLVVNAGISGYTALASSTGTWALYNGVLSYALMGLLLGGEFLFRQVLIRREQSADSSR